MKTFVKKLFFPVASSIISIFILFSCSNSEPDLISSTGTVVVEYSDETSLPDVKLSVFTNARSDSRRIESFIIENKETGLKWRSYSPQIFKINNVYWFGYSNFRSPEGQDIPKGRYTMTYRDLAQEEENTSFNVTYPSEILSSLSKDAKAKMKNNADEKIALYDENDNLVYFDKKKTAWTDWDAIEREYNIAVKKRTVYVEKDQSVMVLLPCDLKP